MPETERNKRYRLSEKGRKTRLKIQNKFWERRHPVLKKLDRIRNAWGKHIEEWFLEELQEQDYKCYACKKKLSFGHSEESTTRACIDHDHLYHTQEQIKQSSKTDDPIYPRMILCNPCNRALGSLNDDPDILERLAKRIREYRRKIDEKTKKIH